MPNAVEQLRFRRAVAVLSGQRIRRRQIPRIPDPAAGRLAYQKLMTARQRTLEEMVREVIFPQLPSLVSQADAERGRVRTDAVVSDVVRAFARLDILFATEHPELETEEALRRASTIVDRKHAAGFNAQMRAGLGVEMLVPGEGLQALLGDFVTRNLALVTSQTGQAMNRLREIVAREVPAGMRVEGIQKQLIDALGVTKSKAALLARDQTLKLNGELSEYRQTSVGITSYVWGSSKDERVRPRHLALDGTPHAWNDPPIVDLRSGRKGHPGSDFQCRCTAIPDVSGLLDQLSS